VSECIRVLHMIGSLNIGGSQSMVLNLYQKIDRNRVQFDFLVDHHNDLMLAKKITELGGRIYFMPPFKGYNILQVIYAWHKFFKEHPEYKVLHSHVRSYASIFILVAKKHFICRIIFKLIVFCFSTLSKSLFLRSSCFWLFLF